MANLHEKIFNRDSRTTFSLSDKIKQIRSSNENSEICENCDREQKRRQKYLIKSQKCIRFSTKSLSYLIIVISIYILSTTALIEANPIRLKRSDSRKINCPNQKSTTRMEKEKLQQKFDALLISCKIAIEDSDAYISDYVEKEFQTTVKEHHARWENEFQKDILKWLYPEDVKLKKKYDGGIETDHLTDINEGDWDMNRLLKHLIDIHTRLTRIRDGLKIIETWNNETKMYKDSSKEIFNCARSNIEETIKQVEEFFCAVENNDFTDGSDSINPPLSLNRENARLDHWFVYREYEHVIKYAKELLDIIKKHEFKE